MSDNTYPVSFGQRRMWFAQQLEPDGCVYTLGQLYRVRGPLDRVALDAALAEVTARHVSLRSRFVDRDGEPWWVVDDAWTGAPRVHDLREVPADVRDDAVRARLDEVYSTPFDLERGPVFRVDVLRVADADHVLAFTMHHIAGDWISFDVLLRDLSASYRAVTEGRAPTLPPVAVPATEVLAAEHDAHHGPAFDRRVAYWAEHVAGAPNLLALPTRRERRDGLAPAGRAMHFTVPADLTARLLTLAAAHRVTPHMATLAAYEVLLSRLSGQDDLLVGMPVAGRTGADAGDVVGFFVNTLPIRADLRGEPTFSDVLGRTRDAALHGYLNQDVPFDGIVEAVAPPRVAGVNPLVQTTFQLLERAGGPPLELAGTTVVDHPLPGLAVAFDLSLNLLLADEVIEGTFLYRAAAFDDETVEWCAAAFVALLRAVTDDPARPVSTLPLLDADRRAAVADLGGAPAAAAGPDSVVDRLVARPAHEPDAVLAVDGQGERTAAAVVAHVLAAANLLRHKGLDAGQVVAVPGPLSYATLVCALGVLAAGSVVLPGDGAAWSEVDLVLGPADVTEILALATADPAPGVDPSEVAGVPAFLVPDGDVLVVVPHAALAALLTVHSGLSRDRVRLTPEMWEAAPWQAILALLCGGLVLPDAPESTSDVTETASATTSSVHHSRTVSSDALDCVYGPVACLGHALRWSEGDRFAAVREPGVLVRVVDPAGRTVPAGVVGELCVGAPYLAAGYLGAPAATADRFVPDPLSADPDDRVFRTGVRGRLTATGLVQILDSASDDRGPMPDRSSTGYEAPLPGNEHTVAEIMAGLLPVTRVGRFDDFFALGGHSLSAVRLASRLRSTLATDVTVRQVFDHPTVAALAAAVADAGDGIEMPALTTGHAGPAPASFAQQRLWFVQQLAPDSSAYTMNAVFRVRGELDVDRLATAVRALVARHESLRTRFAERDGVLLQVVDEDWRGRIEQVDLGGAPAAAVASWVSATVTRTFDLAAGPLFAMDLARLSTDDTLLALTMHHSVGDGWSLDVVYRDLAALYAGAELAPLPVRYGDFAAWQRDVVSGELLDRQLDFWLAELDGAPQVLALPGAPDTPSAGGAPAGGVVRFELPPDVVAGLRALAREAGATLFMVSLAAFGTLLARLSGENDLLVGVPVVGRSREEVDDVVGLFVNTLPLRVDLRDDPEFATLVARTRDRVLAAFANQDLPFERLVEAANPDRVLDVAPLVQVSFQLFEEEPSGLTLAGLDVTAHEHHFDNVVEVPLALDMFAVGDTLRGAMYFNPDLCAESAVDSYVASLRELLTAVAADAATRVAVLPLADAARQAEMLALGTGPSLPVSEGTILEILAEHVRRAPDRPAVSAGGDRLTFGQLDRAAAAVAAGLAARGVRPGQLVALAASRGVHLISGLLGVLRAGAAVVPLDPTQPVDRLRAIVVDADPAALLTDAETGPALESLPVACVDVHQLVAEDTAAPPVVPAPGDAAVVLYTSGSTGRPKGVLLEHLGLANLVHSHRATIFPRAAEVTGRPWARVAITSSIAFDASWDQLLWMVDGHEIHLVDDDVRRDSEALLAEVRGERLDVLDSPQSQVQQLVELGMLDRTGHRPALLLMGGEELRPALWRRLRDEPDLEAYNLYGPTECTVDALLMRLRDSVRPVVGRAVGNTVVRIVDGNLRPVPAGVVGEIFLGGPHVARGYVGAAGLSAERFVPDPFSDGGRLYRTGDLGRFTVDGVVEFLGRVDRQLKVRGYRVEPAEIESVLSEHGSVYDTAVMVRSGGGHDHLVAYVVGKDGPGPLDPAELREHVARRLPGYLVPSAFVTLPELPRLTSGKVDDTLLPAPDATAFSAEFVPPRGAIERVVADVMGEVLGIDRVGRFDDFFALGGHSLSAVRLAARLRAVLRADVSVRVVFESPSVAGLAEAVVAAGDAIPVPPLTAGAPRPAPASFAQQRLWFVQQLEPDSTAYNMNEVFRVVGPLDLAALTAAVHAMVARHESLRTRFAEIDGTLRQLVDAEWTGRVDSVVLDGDDAVAAWLDRLVHRVFDLAEGPLFTVDVARVGADEHLIAFTMHHIISDGWSMSMLLGDLSALYTGADLPPLAVQYSDYATWQRDVVSGDLLDRQLRFWRKEIDGAPQVLTLPGGARTGDSTSFDGGVVRFDVPADVVAGLRAAAREHGATLFMVVLAAFGGLLSRLSGENDLLVGMPVAGRSAQETEGVAGFFVNTLPVRVDLRDDPAVADLVDQVRDRVLAAFAHQDLPFERIVEALNPDRQLGSNPLVQVTFQLFEEEPAAALRLPGTVTSVHDAFNQTARFDLSLDLYRDGEAFTGSLYFRRELFAEEAARDYVRALLVALRAITDEMGTRVSVLPLADDACVAEVLELGRGAPVADTGERTILDAFAEQVRLRPAATAVTARDATWTFAELDRAADAVAAGLAGRGVARGDLVASALGRTAHLVAGILGVLRVGAAVVPLDPTQPEERLRTVVAEAGAVLVLGDGSVPPQRLRCQEVDVATLVREHAGTAAAGAGPRADDLAYVIFTSGSTGRPKGVRIEHGGLVNLLRGHRQSHYRHAVSSAGHHPMRVALSSSVTFDAAWDQILWMFDGNELHVLPDDVRRDSEALVAYLAEHRMDVLNTTPSFTDQLVEDGLLDDGHHRISFLVLGGEAVRPGLWERLAADPHVHAFNYYGPTEATIVSLTASLRDSVRPVVGRAVGNTVVRIVDGDLRPVPVGVVGEILLGGPHVARGYVGCAGLSADRFVPDPFSDGGRLYRTGDLGRFTVGGVVEFLGRVDRQVKVRGYRVEPAEIESALLGHESVYDTAVVVRDDHDLVAYVVPKDTTENPADVPSSLVDSWRSVFEDNHSTVGAADDPDAAIIGWNDSFTGRAIPAAQMREWVDTTVDRILALEPRRLLEVGAGTGLLLRPLLERAQLDVYVATDFSASSLAVLDRTAADVVPCNPAVDVVVARAEALDAADVGPGGYDLVVLNSVAQYFPSLHHLTRLIERVLARVSPGGHLFLGDLRDATLVEAFFAMKHHLLRAREDTDATVADRVLRELGADTELSVAPAYFAAVLARFAAVTAVEITPRRGESVNEMTLFRYDVVLHVGCAADVEDAENVVWRPGADLTMREVQRALAVEERPFGYRGVPNGRLDEALDLRDDLGLTPDDTRPRDRRPGLDLEALCRAGERYGWRARLSWADGNGNGAVDVSFVPAGESTHFRFADPLSAGGARAGYPMFPPRVETALREELRRHLAETLPEYMLPSQTVFLPELPRQASDKIDAAGLPAPRSTSVRVRSADVAPTTDAAGPEGHEVVHRIAMVIGGILRTPVRHDDDFFAVGGDSLTAGLCVRRLRAEDIQVSIRDLFERRTPLRLAELVTGAVAPAGISKGTV